MWEPVRTWRCGRLVPDTALDEPTPSHEEPGARSLDDPREGRRVERLQAALYRIAEAASTVENLEKLYASLHSIVGELMYARNFYIALYDETQDTLSFPYFVDEADEAPPPIRPGKGLTEYVLRTGEPLLASPEVFAGLVERGEIELIGGPSVDWLGVPLKRGEKAFGVLVVQSYSPSIRFTEADRDLLTFVSQNVATAIDRRRAAEALRESEAKFRTLADTAAVAIFIHQGTAFRYANDAMALLTGYTRHELGGMSFWDMVHEDSRDVVKQRSLALERGETVPSRYEFKIVRKDGQERWVDFSAGFIEFGGQPAALGTALDVSERKRAEEEIRALAYYDALTGLPNRQLFLDRLALAMAQAPRQNKSVAVLCLDLDRLKVINDSLGHVVGDRLLQAVAERLQHCLREGDTVARPGADEFTVLAPGLAHLEDAVRIVQKLQEALRQPFLLNGAEIFVSASVGISLYPGDGGNAETLLTNANTAMYRAKESGRDSFQPYTLEMNAQALERLALENSLRKALPNGELELHYQPQVDLATGRTEGLEALLRWRHPAQGFVPPAVFIGLAELTGLIVPIGTWVLRTACAATLSLRAHGRSRLCVAVNLSARQFQQPDLVPEVKRALDDTGLDPQLLEIEITESVAMQNTEATIETLRRLKGLGVRISIDDFGTGHSSLSYLRRFPIDTLKIDQSFVRDITGDPQAAAIVTAIIAMARSLNLMLVAEGVETEEQLAFLRSHGCDRAQGFLLSRPLGLDGLREYLSRREP